MRDETTKGIPPAWESLTTSDVLLHKAATLEEVEQITKAVKLGGGKHSCCRCGWRLGVTSLHRAAKYNQMDAMRTLVH